MVFNEDGFQVAPEWVYVFANVILTLLPLAATVHMLLFYSHSNEKFGKFLTNISIAASLITLIFHLVRIAWPPLCAFYLTETTFFVCEFNLFQFRTALFYQSDKKYYNRLYHFALMTNFLATYHNVIALAIMHNQYPAEWGCYATFGLETLVVGAPFFGLKSYFLYVGFYTVWKYWRESSDDARRKMRILWIVLILYTYDYFTSIFLMAFTSTEGPGPIIREVAVILDKVMSLLLAFMVYLRVRGREAAKAASKTTVKISHNSADSKMKGKTTAATKSGSTKPAGSVNKETPGKSAQEANGTIPTRDSGAGLLPARH